MTTVTDNGLNWYQDSSIGNETGHIDEIAVGSGSGSESATTSGLDSEEYRGTASDTNVTFERTDTGRLEAAITIQGGTEVPDGTEISEMLIEVSDSATIIAIDNFDAVTVVSGNNEEFIMPVQLQRA